MAIKGLTSSEVNERIARGEVNSTKQKETKSYSEIFLKNLLTGFNIILFFLGAVFILMGEITNALAATGVIIINVVVATFQEFKAKKRLDKISLLLRPKVTVIREGEEIIVDQQNIVKDDVVKLTSGDQALVDGEIIDQYYLEMDESLLTGESKTIKKYNGDKIYSGSFCVSGEGYFKVEAFGKDSFASQMLSTAKKQISKKTPLQMETQTITLLLMIVSAIFSLITAIGGLILGNEFSWIIETIAVIVDIVPIALFLLITITYMIAAVRMASSDVLLQESNSVESMSHVNTVCMDKTGTITTNKLRYSEHIEYSPDIQYLKSYVGSISGRNRTLEAIQNQFGTEKCNVLSEIVFSSERKYGAGRMEINGETKTFYLGAFSVFEPFLDNAFEIKEQNEKYSHQGKRTVIFAESNSTEDLESDDFTIPRLNPISLIAIEDVVRSDCRETIEVFLENDMDLKVISGDDPVTVDSLFSLANIPGERKIISGDELAKMDAETFNKTVLETNIFGRMKPDQKEKVIASLRAQGRYVAMVGDGVNDVKSLKRANVGVALESGSSAARGVADMVLVKDNFAALPKALVEGRKTVSGMRDILKIYLSRNFVLAFLIVMTLLFLQEVPLNLRQNTFYSVFAVGLTAFFLAFWAKPSNNNALVLPNVLRYVFPTAASIAIFGIGIFAITGILVDNGTLVFDGYSDIQVSRG